MKYVYSIFSWLLLYIAFSRVECFASGQVNNSSEIDEGNYVMEHVLDSHQWHFATIGHKHFTIYLPIIIYQHGKGLSIFSSKNFFDSAHKPVSYNCYMLINEKIVALDGGTVYDLSLTKTVFAMFISLVIMLVLFIAAAKRYEMLYFDNKPPSGIFAILDILIHFVRDDIAKPNIGALYERFLPYLLSVFFFILINNILGLLPGAANVTGNISVTFCLGLFTFMLTNTMANKNYWKHIFLGGGVPKWLLPLMVPIEIIGIFIKPISLMFRLFANITAGHIILLSIIGIIFILKSLSVAFFSIPFGIFMFMLKLLVAFLQAYIFTLLSSIYFGNSVEEGH
jgi:F-type H+-transporting ATPase subunit a